MSDGEDVQDRLETRVSEALQSIPGYAGYREKEQRRITDRQIRMAIADLLSEGSRELESAGQQLMEQRRFSEAQAIGSLAQRFSYAADKVRTRSYGYAGLFSVRSIEETTLDALISFDGQLLERTRSLVEEVRNVAGPDTTSDIAPDLRSIESHIRSLLGDLGQRDAILENSVSGERPETSSQSLTQPFPDIEWIDLGVGSTLSHFDDNYVIDRVVTLNSEGRGVRLLRLSRRPERWLVELNADHELLAVTEPGDDSTSPNQATKTVISGTAVIDDEHGSTTRSQGTISASEANDRSSLLVEVDLERQQQILIGQRVHQGDLEIFGVPEALS